MFMYASPKRNNKNPHKTVPASMKNYNKKKNSRLVIIF